MLAGVERTSFERRLVAARTTDDPREACETLAVLFFEALDQENPERALSLFLPEAQERLRASGLLPFAGDDGNFKISWVSDFRGFRRSGDKANLACTVVWRDKRGQDHRLTFEFYFRNSHGQWFVEKQKIVV